MKTPKSIACCYEGGLCNLNITPPAYINMNEFGKISLVNEYAMDDHNQNTKEKVQYLVEISLLSLLFVSLSQCFYFQFPFSSYS